MFDLKLLLRLWIRGISLNPNSMRKLTLKRFFVIFVVVPMLVAHLLITHFFLWLDTIFYPNFRKMNTDKSLFIVGMPRSGTSFLLELLANDTSNFTTFKLWELVFAPSILQRKIFQSCSNLSQKLGISWTKVTGKINDFFFSEMKGIHDLDLMNFEEDEFIFFYKMQSVYLIYLFPELEDYHDLIIPDNEQNLQKRLKNMAFYKNLIKRHIYFHDKNQQRLFLSKNPLYAVKLPSLKQTFPKSNYLIIRRKTENCISSALSLNHQIYSFFNAVKNIDTLRTPTIEMLQLWDSTISEFVEDNQTNLNIHLTIFEDMVKQPKQESTNIHIWLSRSISIAYDEYLNQREIFSKQYKSKHKYNKLSADEIKKLKPLT